MTNFRTPDTPVRIGVDGGASKTALIMTDLQGLVLNDHTGPGCSPSHLGPDGARALIGRLLHNLISGIPGIQHQIEQTRLFMAGSPEFWADFSSNLKGFGRVSAADDSVPVLQLACGSDPGLVIHCGTGSFVAARDRDGANHYAGGLGWRLGDPGSAQDIGRRATVRAMMELDGWHSRSEIANLLGKESGHSTRNAILGFFYSRADPNTFLADLAPTMVKLADNGSDEAAAILAESLQPLVKAAGQVALRLDLPSDCVLGLSGNLFSSKTALEIVKSNVLSQSQAWRPFRITDPPIEGVRRILAS
jgi:N-acetylglucosamine kinase-like BadF-type ATPase